jgi:hypothetical protein
LLWCVLVALLLAFIPARAGAQAYSACEPSPAVKAALDQLPQHTPAQTYWQYIEQRLAATEALLSQYLDDVFVHRAFIDIKERAVNRDELIAEYKARHEQDPANVRLAYLYGLTLVGRETPEAIKVLTAVLNSDPKFALPHLELATIYSSRAFLDKSETTSHLKAFLEACPASLEGYQALAPVNDQEFLRPYAVKLRAVVESRSDPDAVGAYRTLWKLEFKAHPITEHDTLRRQVSQDIARLRQLRLEDKPQWYQALETGYNLVEDKKQADWADEQYLTRIPQPDATVGMNKFWDDHMFPALDAPPDKKQAFYRALYEQTGQELKERPNSTLFWAYRFYGLENLDDIPPAEVVANVDDALGLLARNGGPKGLSSGAYIRPAGILSRRHLVPERVIELAEKGLAKWENEAKEPPYDLYSKEELEDQAAFRAYTRLHLLQYEIKGYLQLQQADKAQVQLELMDRWLQDFKLLPGKQNSPGTNAELRAVYWEQRARGAELQGRKQDAMAFYEDALLARFAAQQKQETGRKDELADNAHQLWKSLGATEEGWQLWYGRPANELANQVTLTWRDAQEGLPAFQLADLNNKTWTLAALKGKTVFLNFWASW